MNRPRVLHILTRLGMGASARQVIELSRRMLDSYDVAIAAGPEEEGDGSLHREALSARLAVWTAPSLRRRGSLLSDRRALRELTGMIATLRPAIVHTHQAKAGILGRMAARSARMRHVVHTFHEPLERLGRDGLLRRANVTAERRLASVTDRLIAVSEAVKRDLVSHSVSEPDRIVIILPLVDPERLSTGARFSALRQRLGIDPGAPVIGMVGRLAPPRHPDLFLRAFSTIAASAPGSRAIVAGDGPERAAMERTAARLGLEGRISFLGWTADMAGVYRAIDLLLITSRREGCSVAALEAMATGTPVVGTRVLGVEEIIEDGRTGLLAEPGDVGGLAGAALLLIGDGRFRSRLAAAARKEAHRRFALWASAPRLAALYGELLAGPPARKLARTRATFRASAG